MNWDEDTLVAEVKLNIRNELYNEGEAEVIIDSMQFTIEVGLGGYLILTGEGFKVYSLDLDFILGYILGHKEIKDEYTY